MPSHAIDGLRVHHIHQEGLQVSTTKKSFQFGDHTVTIETGELARQADGAVLVTMSETVVLVTAVGLKKRDARAATSFR